MEAQSSSGEHLESRDEASQPSLQHPSHQSYGHYRPLLLGERTIFPTDLEWGAAHVPLATICCILYRERFSGQNLGRVGPSLIKLHKVACSDDRLFAFCLNIYCGMRPTQELAQSALFTLQSEGFSILDRMKLSYERARAIGRAYGS
jgi:hypothetical protein